MFAIQDETISSNLPESVDHIDILDIVIPTQQKSDHSYLDDYLQCSYQAILNSFSFNSKLSYISREGGVHSKTAKMALFNPCMEFQFFGSQMTLFEVFKNSP